MCVCGHVAPSCVDDRQSTAHCTKPLNGGVLRCHARKVMKAPGFMGETIKTEVKVARLGKGSTHIYILEITLTIARVAKSAWLVGVKSQMKALHKPQKYDIFFFVMRFAQFAGNQFAVKEHRTPWPNFCINSPHRTHKARELRTHVTFRACHSRLPWTEPTAKRTHITHARSYTILCVCI